MSRLLVEMSFDLICPWCLIGKRNLERALRRLHGSHPQVRVEMRWIGVQLLPELPAAGLPFAEFYRRRLGSDAAVSARQAQVQAAAMLAGADIDLQRIARMPNTANAHRLLQRAADLGDAVQHEALLERLFAAYFQRGEDLGETRLLLTAAAECGYEPEAFAAVLHEDARPFVGEEIGLQGAGVPGFLFGRREALVGAHQPDALLHSLLRAQQACEAMA